MTTTTETTEDVTPPASNDNEVSALKAELTNLGEQVSHMAALVLADVPEKFKALIPEGLSPAAQAAWVLKARQSGLFGTVTVPATTAGQKPTNTPKTIDFNSLPYHERIKAGYGK
jgi:hypothetical protein